MEMWCWICWQVRLTVKETWPSVWKGAMPSNTAISDDQVNWTSSWVGDPDMERLLRKEEETRVLRLARRMMSKRKGGC